METASKLFAIVTKFAPGPVLAIGIACTFVLFAKESWLGPLGLDTFRQEYKSVLGWCFVLCWSYLVAQILITMFRAYKSRQLQWQFEKDGKQALNELTDEEKGYLAEFVLSGKNTIHCDMADGIAGGLEAKNIIYRSSSMFNILQGVPYNIQPWAKKALQRNRVFLERAIPRENRRRW